MSSVAPALAPSELVLDRYRPLRPLGHGASGSVWLARDERNGLDVALKIVPRAGKAAHRAEREAEAAARLRHERCLRAYDFGSDSGHVYIAYEYVGGRTLREAMRAGELHDAQAVEAARQILEGLAHAHERGIIHRDVKPTNVLLAAGEGISVRLLDFGLAQFDEAETLTAVGDVPGTLAYISPERLRGLPAEPGSDIWAVGVLLWEALAGRHPFWGVPLPRMAGAIVSGAPSLRSQRPDLPKRLLQTIDRALDPEPGRRPSAAALAEELRHAWDERQRQPRRKSRRESGQKPTRTVGATLTPLLQASSVERLVPAALAGAAVLAGSLALPFYPTGWPWVLAAVVTAVALLAPRLALALALAVPVLPLGNAGLGVALLYAGIATGWLVLNWRDARYGLAFLAGLLLWPCGLIVLLPVVAQVAQGPARRAAHVLAGVAVAALAAGIRGDELPLDGGTATPLRLGADESPVHALQAIAGAVPASLVLASLALAAVAVAIPHARNPWPIAALGAGSIATLLLLDPDGSALPLVAGVWLTCGWLVYVGGAARTALQAAPQGAAPRGQ